MHHPSPIVAPALLALVVGGCAGAYVEGRVGMGQWTQEAGVGAFCIPAPCAPTHDRSRPSFDASVAIGVFVDADHAALHVGKAIGVDRDRELAATEVRVDVAIPVRLPHDVKLRATGAYAWTTSTGDYHYGNLAGQDRFLGATLAIADHDLAATLGLRAAELTWAERFVDRGSHDEARIGVELRVMARLNAARLHRAW